MSNDLVLFSAAEGIATLTINRPDKLNALNDETLRALDRALDRVETEEGILAVIITGAGEKAFVAGADIAEIAERNPVTAREMALRGQALYSRIETLSVPVIAVVNGFALGGGCELAMACHIRLASEKARFGQPEVKLGIIPGYAGTQRLPRLVGKGMAMELILSGRMIDAAEALRIGLVNHVFPPDALMDEAVKLAGEISAQGPLAVRFSMEAINQGLEMPFEAACSLEAHLFATLFATGDMKEGTRAFLEKRAPDFKGE